jgi:hypothetical protein
MGRSVTQPIGYTIPLTPGLPQDPRPCEEQYPGCVNISLKESYKKSAAKVKVAQGQLLTIMERDPEQSTTTTHTDVKKEKVKSGAEKKEEKKKEETRKEGEKKEGEKKEVDKKEAEKKGEEKKELEKKGEEKKGEDDEYEYYYDRK